jgi:hypothetical protein
VIVPQEDDADVAASITLTKSGGKESDCGGARIDPPDAGDA